MTRHDDGRCCEHCGGDLVGGLGDYVIGRVSHGFGQANKEEFLFCGVECRARWRGEDVVLATTRQGRIYEYVDVDVDESPAETDVEAPAPATADAGAEPVLVTDGGWIDTPETEWCAECQRERVSCAHLSELVTDGGEPRETAYLRVDGLSADDVGEEFRGLANDVFAALRYHHGDAVEGVVPVFDEAADPRLDASVPPCAAENCERPMDHVIHGVVLDGVMFDVPTCGRHER